MNTVSSKPLTQQGQEMADKAAGTAQSAIQSTQRAADSAVGYVKDEPIKAMLIAAATGALLMGLVALLSRSSRD